jgi:uncharacterized protein YdhG (YjbR/CyaY superfamily)
LEEEEHMAKTDFQSIDDYIAAQPEAAQAVLERVRATIRKTLPDAEEAISYQIPTFRLHGTYVIYLAGYKHHYSLYPVTEGLLTAMHDEITPYLAGKGTLRFPLSEPVPVQLITRIAKVRGKEVAERAKAKQAATR